MHDSTHWPRTFDSSGRDRHGRLRHVQLASAGWRPDRAGGMRPSDRAAFARPACRARWFQGCARAVGRGAWCIPANHAGRQAGDRRWSGDGSAGSEEWPAGRAPRADVGVATNLDERCACRADRDRARPSLERLITITRDGLPVLARADLRGEVWYAYGWNGHGLVPTVMAGARLAKSVLRDLRVPADDPELLWRPPRRWALAHPAARSMVQAYLDAAHPESCSVRPPRRSSDLHDAADTLDRATA